MESANIYKDITYKDNGPAISVLYQTEATKEVRIVFKQGQLMKEHQTPYPITVALIDGELDFGVGGNILHLVKGDLLSLAGGVPHDLLARTDCIVRLTLGKGDAVQRVKDVAEASQPDRDGTADSKPRRASHRRNNRQG